MDGEQQIQRKRRNLIIDDDEEDFVPQSITTPSSIKNLEKSKITISKIKLTTSQLIHKLQKIEETIAVTQSNAPSAPIKNIKDVNGNNRPVSNNQPVKNSIDNLNNKNKDKVVRKEFERVQVISSKIEVESDGHASDKDLFLPDDSNSQDIQEIRAKFGWKAKPAQNQIAPKVSKPISAVKNTSSSRSREEPVKKGKDTVVYEVLKRWWYALPDWPPAHYDYTHALEVNKLRQVNKQKFRIAPDVDERGFQKCYEILGYAGLFKDVNNKLYDLRPEEGKPSYNSLSRKSDNELIGLLKVCLERQIEELQKSKVVDEELLTMLKRQYEKVKLRANS